MQHAAPHIAVFARSGGVLFCCSSQLRAGQAVLVVTVLTVKAPIPQSVETSTWVSWRADFEKSLN